MTEWKCRSYFQIVPLLHATVRLAAENAASLSAGSAERVTAILMHAQGIVDTVRMAAGLLLADSAARLNDIDTQMAWSKVLGAALEAMGALHKVKRVRRHIELMCDCRVSAEIGTSPEDSRPSATSAEERNNQMSRLCVDAAAGARTCGSVAVSLVQFDRWWGTDWPGPTPRMDIAVLSK